MRILIVSDTHRRDENLKEVIRRTGPLDMMINPGSLSYPRQDGHKPSFMLMEIDKEGEAHFSLNFL